MEANEATARREGQGAAQGTAALHLTTAPYDGTATYRTAAPYLHEDGVHDAHALAHDGQDDGHAEVVQLPVGQHQEEGLGGRVTETGGEGQRVNPRHEDKSKEDGCHSGSISKQVWGAGGWVGGGRCPESAVWGVSWVKETGHLAVKVIGVRYGDLLGVAPRVRYGDLLGVAPLVHPWQPQRSLQ